MVCQGHLPQTPPPPTITISDPDNVTYTQTSVTAQISLSETGDSALYSLDGAANVTMTMVSGTLWTASLSGLADLTTHTIIFFANDSVNNVGNSSIVYFTVDTTANDTTGPAIVVLSPLNNSFHNSSVLLNISLDESGSEAWYSLDGGANTSLGNASLTLWNATIIPSQGSHNITFYANDSSSNLNTGVSSTIFFTFDNTSPQFSTASTDPSTVNDNVSVICTSSWTDNVGLAFGIVEENATGSFANHTIILSGTSGDVNHTIPAVNLTPGGVTCVFYVNDTSGNLNSTSTSFTVNDVTAPSVTNITHSPTTEADLDVNTNINVTVNATDNFNLQAVILQFKEANGTYLNFTMDSLSGDLYTGNFTANTTNNWTYRILAEDASGNQNISSETNLSVAQDKTWTLYTTIPSTKSIIQTENRVITLGNITINNTGDSELEFNLSSTVSWLTFNGTTSTSLSVNITSDSFINLGSITANTTGFAVGLYSFAINITANDTLSSPQTNSTSGQVNIQNTAGPYLSVTMTTFTSSVDRGDTGVSYTSKVENLGTQDATGVWLAWELPAEFSLATGNLNRSIGNLPIGTSATNSITIDVSSTADDKNVTINTTTNSAQGVGDSESRTVTIGTPTTVTTTTTTTTTGDSGGGGGTSTSSAITQILRGKELVESSETIELVRGETGEFPVKVQNIFKKTTLLDVSLNIEGFFSQYMSVSPQKIAAIAYDEEGTFVIKITSPSYLETGTHELILVVTGTIKGGGVVKDFIETRTVTLIIHEVSEGKASNLLQSAATALEEMNNAEFPTTRTAKLLQSAESALDKRDFEEVRDIVERVLLLRDNAFEADRLMQEVRDSIQGVSFTGALVGVSNEFVQTENLLKLAEAAFGREDFETALKRAQDSKLTLAVETGGFSPLLFVLNYWWAILIVIVMTTITGKLGYKQHLKNTISDRIMDLDKEEETIMELMKKTQQEHFEKGKMGTDSYHAAMSRYQRRLAHIKKERTKLRNKRVRLLRPELVLRDLDKENSEVKELLKNAQVMYLQKNTMSREEYKEQEKQLTERLAEIEDERLIIQSQSIQHPKEKK